MGGSISWAGQGFYRSEIQCNFKKYYNFAWGRGDLVSCWSVQEGSAGGTGCMSFKLEFHNGK